jgi:purine-nucleoside phosphorylase
MITVLEQLDEAVQRVRAQSDLVPEIGLILGSGLGFIGDRVDQPARIAYADLPGFPVSTVEGHAGRLVLGHLAGRRVAVMQGRFHYYEGYSLEQVAVGARLIGRLGARLLIVTNAAGGIREDLEPGDLMLISDHINLMGGNPLMGRNLAALGPRFPDLSDAYCRELREQARAVAERENIPIREGVYAAFSGPSYETPAEIRALRTLGADAVGMSTIPEVIAACHMGLKVLGISCISNLAAGIGKTPLSHDEVRETTQRVQETFSRFVLALVGQIR